MSEVIETPAEVTETVTVEETPAEGTPDHAAEAAKWKALSRKNEDRAKENEAKAKSYDDVQEANKSEAEKLLSRAETAEKALAERDAKEATTALIAEVAKEKGVPVAILRGATREELEEHADAYLTSLPVVPNAPSSEGLGKVGEPVGGSGKQLTRDDLQGMSPKEITTAQDAGLLSDLLGINP